MYPPPQQQFQQPLLQPQTFQPAQQQMYGMGAQMPYFSPRPRGRFPRPPIDKTNSTCKACQGIGHWAGDVQCPLNGFPTSVQNPQAQMLALPAPMQPGQPTPPVQIPENKKQFQVKS